MEMEKAQILEQDGVSGGGNDGVWKTVSDAAAASGEKIGRVYDHADKRNPVVYVVNGDSDNRFSPSRDRIAAKVQNSRSFSIEDGGEGEDGPIERDEQEEDIDEDQEDLNRINEGRRILEIYRSQVSVQQQMESQPHSVSPQQNGVASVMTSDDNFYDGIFGDTPTGRGDLGGYYDYQCGEILDDRYRIISFHGRGVFSTVIRAKNLRVGNGEPEEVAIKILRNSPLMYRAGHAELAILQEIARRDPYNMHHCVRFLSNFEYQNHLCLVFESLDMNLQSNLNCGSPEYFESCFSGHTITTVRHFARQLLIALLHLKDSGVLHCDIKPENMLLDRARNELKLCDFGCAVFSRHPCETTPYLVSRFYRSPEIILGLRYGHPVDMWSVGCSLYELYTGKILFAGATNNDMLRLHQELRGPFPEMMLRNGEFTNRYFDEDLNFRGHNIQRRYIQRILTGRSWLEDPRMVDDFKDLLDKMLVLDPDSRVTVLEALNHPFIIGRW